MNIPFSKINTDHEEIEAVTRVLQSGWLAAGKEVTAFEEEFSTYISPEGVDKYHCIFTNSCTSALKMAYKWNKEQGLSQFSYPLNTFCATYSAAVEMGLDVCQYGGIKDTSCPESRLYVANAAEPLQTFQQTAGSIAHDPASIKAKWVSEYQSRLNYDPKSEGLPPLSSPEGGLLDLTRESIGQSICGSEGTGESPSAASNAGDSKRRSETKTTFNGQIRTVTIPGYEKTGNSYVGSATSPTTARVNMAYGGVKDETPCLIEDSAHRIEPNDPLIGKIRCYSFYATKNMTTGSGGMFVTNDREIYERARLYWRDGLTTSTASRMEGFTGYRVETMAGGYDGNDLAAAIGRVQLGKLPEFARRRNEIRDYFNAHLNQEWGGNHLYPFFVKDEADVYRCIAYMKDKGISCSHHYPNTGWNGVSLPIYPSLTTEELDYIVQACKDYATRV